MIRRIVLENYMSHANTVIEPAESGLTVLVGPNNCGKSAVVSALLTVCGENDGDFMVRHGEKHARVTVETAEGDTIVWQRKGKSPSYVINGTDVHRVGRGNLPDELQPLLKLPVIEFGEGSNRSRFVVHFGLQKAPIFLIDSESDVAKFFSSSAEAERLLTMQRRHKKKTQDARGELRAIESDLALAAGQLETLAPLDVIGVEVEAVEAQHRELVERERAADELANRIARIETAGRAVARERARAGALDGLHAAPPMDDPASLDRVIERIAKTGRERSAVADRQAALGALRDPPAQEDPEPLTNLGKALSRAEREFKFVVAQIAAYDQLLDAPAFDDPAPLAQVLERAAAATSRAAECDRAATNASRAFYDAKDQIVAWVTQNPVCPVCGNPTDSDGVLDAGGTHAH